MPARSQITQEQNITHHHFISALIWQLLIGLKGSSCFSINTPMERPQKARLWSLFNQKWVCRVRSHWPRHSKHGEQMSGRFRFELFTMISKEIFTSGPTCNFRKYRIGTYRMSQALGDIINSLPFPRLSCTYFQSNGFETLQQSPLAVK